MIRRPLPDPDEVAAVAALLAAGPQADHHRRRRRRLLRRRRGAGAARRAGRHPGAGDLGRQGRGPAKAWWQLGGIGLEGTPGRQRPCPTSRLRDQRRLPADRLPHRSQSLFENPDVRFASINVNGYDAQRLGATGIVGDAKLGLAALADRWWRTTPAGAWRDKVRAAVAAWAPERAAALDPDTPFDRASIPPTSRRRPGHRRGAHPGAAHRAAAGARPTRATPSSPRPAGPPATCRRCGTPPRPVLPSGVRVLLHGLRAARRDGRAPRRAEHRHPDHDVHRRRHLPDGADRTGHRGAGGST